MRIISFATWAKSVSAALFDNETLICADSLIGGNPLVSGPEFSERISTSAELAPMTMRLMEQAGWEFSQLDLVVVSIGPGSFTGLRIGVVSAKSMAYSLSIPIVGVNTLEAISALTASKTGHEFSAGSLLVKAAVNAQRKQLFASEYRVVEPWHCEQTNSLELFDRQEWIDGLTEEQLVSGAGLSQVGDQLAAKGHKRIAPESSWHPDAEVIGRVGIARHGRGLIDDLWTLEPLYFRPSAAEEKLALASNPADSKKK